MALQALALYSEKTAGNALDLRVKVWTESGGVDVAHHITTENALLRREITVRSKINLRYKTLHAFT